MRCVIVLAILLAFCLATEAGERRSKARRCGESAVAVALAHCTTCQPNEANTEKKLPQAKAQPTETVTPANITSSGNCLSGSCGVPTRYSRRGR